MSIPYFCHLSCPFFQVCESEGDIGLLAKGVIFHDLWFLVDKGGNFEGGHHLLPVMYASFVTVFSFIFLSLSFLCIRRVRRRRRSWDILTVLEYCTLLMWRRQTLELDFDLALIRIFRFLRTP